MTNHYFRSGLIAVCLLMIAGAAQASTTYYLKDITFETSSVPGNEYPFGSGFLANSACHTCGTASAPGSLAVDDGAGNLSLTQVSFTLNGFGADFTDTFEGTTMLGIGTDLDKTSDTCTVNNASTQYCDPNDVRSYAGDWLTGFLADGTTASAVSAFDAVASGNDLTLSVTKSRDNPESGAWLKMNFNYQVVPVPAAVWLFGSALGLLGWVRRRSA